LKLVTNSGVDAWHSYAYLRRLTSDVLEAAPVWDTHAHVGRDRDGRELDFIGLLRDLDDYRVNGAVIFPFNDPEQGTDFRVPNDRVWDAYRAAPERFIPFMRLNPNGPWEDEYERCRDRGHRGIKLHPRAQDFVAGSVAVFCLSIVQLGLRSRWLSARPPESWPAPRTWPLRPNS
jgi:predicted TIM-barrel fold metal-dependent hydrolase